jgi:transcriptional regulator with XRE-family HTH domain
MLMLSRPQFVAWLQARRDAGETLKAIGAKFGVSHVTVVGWLSGRKNPSRMALVLAGEFGRAPVEMAPGLPSPREPFSGA